MWHYVYSRIWRTLHRDIETDRNHTSEELLKLVEGQKILIFFIWEGGVGCRIRGRSESFHFQGACPLRGEGVNFLGGGSYASAYYGKNVHY